MRFFIVEDDISVIRMLTDIIEDAGLGTVCGDTEGKPASVREILAAKPDVVLVDFLMPETDGISVVSALREQGCSARIVMISQVSDKEMVAKAYDAGVDFFISKPINRVEICSVISHLQTAMRNEETLSGIRRMFTEQPGTPQTHTAAREEAGFEDSLRLILNRVGMAGEKGTEDIIKVCLYLKKNNTSLAAAGIGNICATLSPRPKNMEQRIRRAVAVGMSSVAHLGIEDFMNETFSLYSSTLFAFEDIRAEMDFIRGKAAYGGKVNIRKFIDGLMLETDHK